MSTIEAARGHNPDHIKVGSVAVEFDGLELDSGYEQARLTGIEPVTPESPTAGPTTSEEPPNHDRDILAAMEREEDEADAAALLEHLATQPEFAGLITHQATHFKLEATETGAPTWTAGFETVDTTGQARTETLELTTILETSPDLLDAVLALEPGADPLIRTQPGRAEDGRETVFVTAYARTAGGLIVATGEVPLEPTVAIDRSAYDDSSPSGPPATGPVSSPETAVAADLAAETEPPPEIDKQFYILENNDLIPLEANEELGIKQEPHSEQLRDEMLERHLEAMAALVGGEAEFTFEMLGVIGHTDTTERYMVMTYRLAGAAPEGRLLVEVSASFEDRPRIEREPEAAEFDNNWIDDGWTETGTAEGATFELSPLLDAPVEVNHLEAPPVAAVNLGEPTADEPVVDGREAVTGVDATVTSTTSTESPPVVVEVLSSAEIGPASPAWAEPPSADPGREAEQSITERPIAPAATIRPSVLASSARPVVAFSSKLPPEQAITEHSVAAGPEPSEPDTPPRSPTPPVGPPNLVPQPQAGLDRDPGQTRDRDVAHHADAPPPPSPSGVPASVGVSPRFEIRPVEPPNVGSEPTVVPVSADKITPPHVVRTQDSARPAAIRSEAPSLSVDAPAVSAAAEAPAAEIHTVDARTEATVDKVPLASIDTVRAQHAEQQPVETTAQAPASETRPVEAPAFVEPSAPAVEAVDSAAADIADWLADFTAPAQNSASEAKPMTASSDYLPAVRPAVAETTTAQTAATQSTPGPAQLEEADDGIIIPVATAPSATVRRRQARRSPAYSANIGAAA